MIEMKKSSLLLSVSLTALLLSGCGIDNTDDNIVGNNLLVTEQTFTPTITLPQAALGATALAGIKSYKINYTTKDDAGNDVTASGLITIPDLSAAFYTAYKNNQIPGLDNPKHNDFTLSIVSDQHGTIFTDAESPSKTTPATIASNNPLAIAFSANALFITVQPDYLGYGDSNISHPFIIEKTLANSTVDMIKAAISFSNKAGLPINGQVFLSGYSEGGYATMAAAKEIQANHPEINLMAVAPMAGPYDVEGMAIGTLSADMMAFPPFLAYLAHAYATTYDDVTISDVVNAPYASMLSTLFDGQHTAAEIYGALPNVFNGGQETDKLFVPSYSDDIIGNSDNSLRKRFVENSVTDWKPTMPMKLYHCTNDLIIPYAMSTLAHASFTDQGSTSVELAPINSIDSNLSNPTQVHAECASAAYAQVIPWFASIRTGE